MSKDIQKEMEERRNAYGKECLQELEGTELAGVTETQAQLILLPNHAPENFYCDGEISPQQAVDSWVAKLQRSGLSPQLIAKAIKHSIG